MSTVKRSRLVRHCLFSLWLVIGLTAAVVADEEKPSPSGKLTKATLLPKDFVAEGVTRIPGEKVLVVDDLKEMIPYHRSHRNHDEARLDAWSHIAHAGLTRGQLVGDLLNISSIAQEHLVAASHA